MYWLLVLLATYALLLSDTETKGSSAVSVSNLYRDMYLIMPMHCNSSIYAFPGTYIVAKRDLCLQRT